MVRLGLLKSWIRGLWPRRFIVQVALMTSSMVVIGIVVLMTYTVNELIKQQHRGAEQRLSAIANNLAFSSAHFILIRDQSSLEQLLVQTANYPGLRSFVIIDASNRVLSEVKREPGKSAEATFGFGKFTPPQKKAAQFVWRYGDRDQDSPIALGLDATALVMWQPIEGGNLGWLRIETAVDEIQFQAFKLIKESALFALLAVIFISFALFRQLRPSLHAVSDTINFARELTLARGQQIKVFTGSIELEQLGLAMNETALRLYTQETALKEQAQHTQAILDNMADGLITTDQHGIIHSINPAAERIFGYTPEEIKGRSFYLLLAIAPDEHDNRLLLNDQMAMMNLMGNGGEMDGRRKDGSLFPMEMMRSKISHEERPMTVCMIRDITERRRIERMKNEFVSTVSHELRTPLTSIEGALGLIVGGAVGNVSEKAQQMIDIAYKNSRRLKFLINDLLDMEKLVAGKMQFDWEQVALLPFIEEAIEANRTYGAARGVTLVLTKALHAAPPTAEVKVDSQRLMQVMSNLLSNAIKYSPENGVVEIQVVFKEDMLRVTVTDQGSGIPAEFHARIFQKFSQADSSDTRQKGGSGLGLAITQELVTRMDGRIGFDSVEGAGASFYIELPLYKTLVLKHGCQEHA